MGVSRKKFDVQGSSSSNDPSNECVGIAKILKINERTCTLFKHLRYSLVSSLWEKIDICFQLRENNEIEKE